LVDIDSKCPNLALMKLSAWHKRQGDECFLFRCGGRRMIPNWWDFKRSYISCVYSWNSDFAKELGRILPNAVLGGYGVNGAKLPDEVEHLMPDYELYGCDYSLGFTTRGCHRRCDFCNVWRTEGEIRPHARIEEFHHPNHDEVKLLDNNILALPRRFDEDLEYIREHGLTVDFNQGLDCRLFDEEAARKLSDVDIDPVRFSFDAPEQEPYVRRAIELTREHITDNYRKIIVYVLFNYRDTLGEALHRASLVRDLGATPFPQRFTPPDSKSELWVSPNWTERLVRDFQRYWSRAWQWKSHGWEEHDAHYKARAP